MPKLSKSRLLKSIPLVGFVFFLAVFIGILYWLDLPEGTAGTFALGPAVMLLLVAMGLIRLQTAILIQGVIVGTWWRGDDDPYLWVIIGTVVGLKLGEWVGNWWTSAIDRAKAEEALAKLSPKAADKVERPAGTNPQRTTQEISPADRV